MAVDLDRLKTILNQSGIQQQNQPLYQVIWNLLDAVRAIQNNVITITGGGGGGGSLPNATYVTINPEQATLPFSRQIIAGEGVSFNNTGTKLIINVAVPLIAEILAELLEMGQQGPPGIDGKVGPMGPPGMDAHVEEIYEMGFVGNSLHNGSVVTGEYRQVI